MCKLGACVIVHSIVMAVRYKHDCMSGASAGAGLHVLRVKYLRVRSRELGHSRQLNIKFEHFTVGNAYCKSIIMSATHWRSVKAEQNTS